METNPKKQRQHFYRDYSSGQWSMSELCDRYQISRPTGYKWIDRIEIEGLKAGWRSTKSAACAAANSRSARPSLIAVASALIIRRIKKTRSHSGSHSNPR
jgi:transposase-like protein